MPRSLPLAVIAIIGLCALTACSAPSPAPSSPPPSASSAPSSDPTPIGTPDTTAPDQIAAVLLSTGGEAPTTKSITGPATMSAEAPVSITAACTGGSLSYELRTAAADESQRMLMSSSVVCDGTETVNQLEGADYAGPVQLVVVSSDGVDAGWVQATQPAV